MNVGRPRAGSPPGHVRLGPSWIGATVEFRRHTLETWLGLLLVALTAPIVAVIVGSTNLPVSEVIAAVVGEGNPTTVQIVRSLRIPRALIGALAGAALGASGAIFQDLSRNPLGSPDIIGFTTGAATGAIIAIIYIDGGPRVTAFMAMLGGLTTSAVVYLLARGARASTGRLILMGIGCNAFLVAINGLLIVRAGLTEARAAVIWQIGSISGRGLEQGPYVSLALLVLLVTTPWLTRGLDSMRLGEDVATSLGVAVGRVRAVAYLVGITLAAAGVAAVGPIVFIALVAPQVARRLVRSGGADLLSSALVGAALLVASDLAAQRVVSSGELPVGLLTLCVGGGYLAWFLIAPSARGR